MLPLLLTTPWVSQLARLPCMVASAAREAVCNLLHRFINSDMHFYSIVVVTLWRRCIQCSRPEKLRICAGGQGQGIAGTRVPG